MSIVIEGVHHPLYRELSAIVGEKYCSDEDCVRICYSNDTSPAPSRIQGIVVRPGNTEQVVDIVKLANYTRTPIIPSGGRAALYGAPPGLVGKGIVVDMTRMRKVLNIDEKNQVVTAEGGCTVAEMNALVNERGWDVYTALQPYYSDTVGGQISGVLGAGTSGECTATGWNGNHITGVKVVLPTGDVIQTGVGPGTNVNQKIPFAREPGAPDMTGMFIGDAGIFGLKVEATYRIYRLPKVRAGKFVMFPTFDKAYDFCMDVTSVDPTPCYLVAIMVPTPFITRLSGMTSPAVTIRWKGNSEEEAAQKFAEIEKLVKKHGGNIPDDPIMAGFAEEGVTMKRHREMGSFGSLGYWTFLELMSPRDQIKECRDFMTEMHEGGLDKAGIPYDRQFGIVAVGQNQWILSSVIFLKGWDHKAMAVMHGIWKKGLEDAVARGWCPDANQGYASICMGKYWSPAFAAFMRNIKKTLDPNNIMNPGLWGLE